MIRDQLLSLVKSFEGCRLQAYKDIVGVITIGYGATGPGIQMDTVWTQTQADNDLINRLTDLQSKIQNIVIIDIDDNQLDALTDFAYNLGLGALHTSTLLRKLNENDIRGAADEILKWNKAGGKEIEGLTRRREAERNLFLK